MKFSIFIGVAISFSLTLILTYLLVKRPIKIKTDIKNQTAQNTDTTLGDQLESLNIELA